MCLLYLYYLQQWRYGKVFYLAPFAHLMVCFSEFDKELDIDI